MIKSSLKHETFTFPAGEMHVRLKVEDERSPSVNVTWEFKKSEDIVELLLYCNALKEAGYVLSTLEIPYFPFSRQDRVAVPGECFSLRVMCDLVNSLKAERVIIYDPHSHVLPALLDNVSVVSQASIFAASVRELKFKAQDGGRSAVLIAPDAGALKKTYELAACAGGLDVVTAFKHRDPKTGDITNTEIVAKPNELDGKTCIIVDDICDGGRTFVEIAKVLRRDHLPQRVILMVTHGLFTKGFGVFDGLIDEFYTRAGKVSFMTTTPITNMTPSHPKRAQAIKEIMERRAV